MKIFLLTISGIAAFGLSSCINPPATTGTGQNRFGYNGTTSANTKPTSGAQQGAASDPVATTGVVENTQTQTTLTQSPGNDPIAIDLLPTDTSTNTPPTNNGDVATNDTTTSTNRNTSTSDKPKKPEYLYGIPVPGRDGMVYSPYNKDAGYIDVRHMKPGALAEDPYTPGKLFRVP